VLEDEREQVCHWARRTAADGLVVGRSGNLSVRSGDLLAVTPTGVNYDRLRPHDVPVVRLDGTPVDGDLVPTSELPMHLAAYAADRTRGAVVHTHAVHATAVSLLVDEVPPVHYVLGTLGDSVRVAPYATYGTAELADHMVAALADRHGCLLRNHGTVTTGTSLDEAYERTLQLEWACRVWLLARSAGEPTLLSTDQMREATRRLSTYGQPAPAGPANRPLTPAVTLAPPKEHP
jgi:L-fuculose-phosphate aldolase